ncbi:TOMM system kinase/cyclase fusion protein [Shewanella surugensis]|uniref:TOMM system kinase/cyclase fusion protein n=1 Tax=Shewanella surugensis TaxID=212020 RepID=A0ABT0L8F0_9GAMM|nr:TOMM system kinase/cyclase fusion protein [Shewanella surugensis]MCL1123956.1 TOMM system kinase/cyclase fusion protein [Shewanella surugensis]
MNTFESSISYIPKKFKSADYQLLDKIGQGGFGQVYTAMQVNTGQIVAIKFLTLNPDFDEDKRHRYIARFHRETQLNSRLSHPNIVRLLDKGCVDNDLIYAVFEYIEGQSLKEILLEKGALRPIQTVNVMSQVLDSLAHAHDRGVIHRDLKPANIMLMTSDVNHHVKILDFGIGALTNEARQADDQSITLTQETLGTPSYSAPEQLRGEPPTVKSDLYVWGLVFLECLTGQAVMAGSNLASIFHKQLSQSNVPIPAVLAGHPVVSLLRRVLNKKVQDRAGVAIDVYHELNKLNFSSLVGDFNGLNHDDRRGELTPTVARVFSNDETQINPDAFAISGFIERKQISVLCLSLSIRAVNEGGIDIDVIDAIHRDQQSQCSDIAVSYGAFHVGSLGDTQLFYFGYPKVSDNDSRLCARTALEINSRLNKCNALLKLSVGIEVQVRMGMNTGIVTHYRDSAPEGDTANLAMELMRHAQPQQILCTQASERLLENHIEFTACAITDNHCFIKSLLLYQFVGERKVEAFCFLRVNRTHHDFIGRSQELEHLLALLKQNENNGAFVFGEAGMGKSRLIFEFRQRAKGHLHLIAQCLPEHQFNALYPILSLLKDLYSVEDSSSNTLIEHFTLILNKHSNIDTEQGVSVLCIWLNLPLPEDISMMALILEQQKKILFEVLVILLFITDEDSDKKNVLFVFEDLHWIDPTSLEFVCFLLHHSLFKCGKVTLVMTSRVALPQLLKGLMITPVKLMGLAQVQTYQIIKNMFEHQNVALRVLELVCTRTDGIPLFIEELVNMLRYRNWVQVLNGQVDFVSEAVLLEIPNTLLDSLQQKLDALVYAKETVQLAACIGREFDYQLLVSTSNRTEEKVQNDIVELLSHELVYQLRQVKGDRYIFKHALVREAAYANIESRNRKLFHGLIAHELEQRDEHNVMEVALHFSYAEHFTQATRQGIVAVTQLATAGANAEVLSFGERLLQWVEKIEAPIIRDCSALAFYQMAISSELVVNSYTSERAHEWSQAIRAILLRLPDEVKRNEKVLCHKLKVVSEFLRFLHLHHSSQYQAARTLGEALLSRYSKEEYQEYDVPTLCFLSQNYQLTGHFHHSIEAFEKALYHYGVAPQQLFMENNTDFKPYCLGMLALSYLHIDQLDKAIVLAQSAVSLSDQGQYQVSCIASHIFYALCMSFKGDDAQVIRICEGYYQQYFNPDNPIFYTIYIDILLETARDNLDKAKQRVIELCDSDYDFATGWYIHFIAKKMVKMSRVDEALSLMELSYKKSIKNNEMAALPIVKNALAWVLFEKEKSATPRVIALLQESQTLAKKQKAYLFVKEAQLLQDKIHENV